MMKEKVARASFSFILASFDFFNGLLAYVCPRSAGNPGRVGIVQRQDTCRVGSAARENATLGPPPAFNLAEHLDHRLDWQGAGGLEVPREARAMSGGDLAAEAVKLPPVAPRLQHAMDGPQLTQPTLDQQESVGDRLAGVCGRGKRCCIGLRWRMRRS